jgi:hypothetical protein
LSPGDFIALVQEGTGHFGGAFFLFLRAYFFDAVEVVE